MAGYGAGQVIRLGGNLILTRLLFPEVFGQMALVQIFIQGLAMFSDVGTGPAIVQSEHGDDPRFLDTAWTIQSARGVALWLAACAIAAPVAAFYQQPLLAWLIPASAFGTVLAGLEHTAMHSLQRHLKLGKLTLVELAAQVVGTFGTVGLAFADRAVHGPNNPGAVWAVVGGGLIAAATRLVLSHTALPGQRHRFLLDPEMRRRLFHFGRWIFLSTLLTFLAAQSDRLVFGKLIPLDLFGVYGIAVMLSALPTEAVLKLGGAVVFPAYARLAGRPDFRQVFEKVRLPLLLGSAAIVSGLIAAGPFLIRLMYDRRYLEAGWILQYLSAMAWFRILECTNGQALLAKGNVRWVAAGSAAKLVGLVGLIPLGFYLGGFPGALIGLVAAEAVKYVTSATGMVMSDLPGWRRDAVFTAGTALVAWAGFAAGEAASAAFLTPVKANLAGLLAGGLVALVAWGLIGLGVWKGTGPAGWRGPGRAALALPLGLSLLLLGQCRRPAKAAAAALPPAPLTVAAPPFAASSCAAEPLRTKGEIRYVCDCQAGAQAGCVAGDDAAPGTSPAAPWRSWEKARARFETMPAGATVAFCDGGSFTGVGRPKDQPPFRNLACRADATCDLRDYAAPWGGAGVRPRLALGPGNAFLEVGWYQQYASRPGYTGSLARYVSGVRIMNLELLGQSADGLVTAEGGVKLWGGVTDLELCNLEVHHGLYAALDLVTNSSLSRITLRDSYVHDNRGHICVVCGTADDLVVKGNVFDRNGAGNQFSHTIYLYASPFEKDKAGAPHCGNGGEIEATYCPVRKVTLAGNVIARSAWGAGARCVGVAVSAHDVIEGLTVEGNLVAEPGGTAGDGCYGIAFGAGGEAARFRDLVIRNNRIFNVGGNGIAVSGAPGAVIENNLVAGGAPLTTGIAYPEQAARAGVDLPSRDGRVRNNSVYLASGGDGSYALRGIDEGSGHLIANNAIVTGPSTAYCVKAPAGATVAGNQCAVSGQGWWAAPGLDPATADFRPAPGSLLQGTGISQHASAADLIGVVRGDPPAVGAWEKGK